MGEIHYIMDGVSLNHAGEVIFNESKTKDVRRNSSDIYKSSLIDLCHALFFGDTLKINQNMYPGILRSESSPSLHDFENGLDASQKLVSSIEDQSDIIRQNNLLPERNPQIVLENEEERESLISYIKVLAAPYLYYDIYKGYWRHFLQREFAKYASEYPVMFESHDNMRDYDFPKPYLYDEDILSRIPTQTRDFFTNIVLSTATDPRTTIKAARAFALRSVLTHLAIFENYKIQLSLINRDRNLHYLPCSTRSSLTYSRKSIGRPEEKRYDLIALNILPYILKKVHKADGMYFLMNLCEFSENPRNGWEDVKSQGQEIFTKFSGDKDVDDNDFKSLRRTIRQVGGERGILRRVYNAAINIISNIKIGFGPDEVKLEMDFEGILATFSADHRNLYEDQELDDQLKRVFPHTFETKT